MNNVVKNHKYKNLQIDVCDYSHIESYLKRMCGNIYDLLNLYCAFYNIINADEYINRCLHNDNIYSAGQVRECDVYQIPQDGNIRELMTFIYMFGLNGSKIILSLMLDDEFYNFVKNVININEDRLLTRYNNFKMSVGLNDKNSIIALCNNERFKKNCSGRELIKTSGDTLPCLFVSLVKIGMSSISKNGDFPFVEKTRIPNRENYNENLYNAEEIYPKLSIREIAWFNEKNITDYIPWKSGAQYYKMNDNSYYKMSAEIYNQKTLSGFSGTSDLVLDVLSLFDEYKLNISLHSCLIWICSGSIKDHSIYEVLVSLMPYGLDYCINIDAEEYCIKNGYILRNYY